MSDYDGPERRSITPFEQQMLEKIHAVNDNLIELKTQMDYFSLELQKNTIFHDASTKAIQGTIDKLSSMDKEVGILHEKITSHIENHGKVIGIALIIVGMVGTAFGWVVNHFSK